MAAPQETRFDCPLCGSRYTVVRVEMQPAARQEEEIACVKCGAPLQARDGSFALKYFLLGPTPGGRRRRR